jgi:hypothetical protein
MGRPALTSLPYPAHHPDTQDNNGLFHEGNFKSVTKVNEFSNRGHERLKE